MIYLFRHGQTDWNKNRIVQGSTNIPLNETGIQQAEEKTHLFKGVKLDALVSSPLIRARKTAEILGREADYKLRIIDERLTEREFGVLETHPIIYGGQFYAMDYRGKGSEDPDKVYTRMCAAIEDLGRRFDGEVLVVSHGSALTRYLIGNLGPIEEHLKNLGCVIYDQHEKRMIGYNFSDQEIIDFLQRNTN